MTGDGGPTPLPRHGLRGWFRKVRTRRWARLFLFEFLVVLLGVLCAQALANWLSAQAERDRAQQAKIALDTQLAMMSREIAMRARSSSCFHLRLDELRQDIAAEREPSVTIYPPFGASFSPINWQGTTPSQILKHEGRETAAAYDAVNRLLVAAAAEVEREQQAWNGFTRLTQQFGTPEARDFAAAEEAWLQAERSNHVLERMALSLAGGYETLGITMNLEGLDEARGADDPCVAALSYTLAEHRAAKEKGELVTGEDISGQFFWQPKPRSEQ